MLFAPVLMPIILFFLGVIMGSFLNVLGLRWNSGLTLGGRSFCVVCRKGLSWWELVPVVSFIGLEGECSECKTKISWQYPLIELWTGLLFVTIYNSQLTIYNDFNLNFIVSCFLLVVVFCIFVVITIYDARHKIIPDSLVYSAVILAIIYRLLTMRSGYNLLDLLAGPILFSFFALIWLISRGRAMGLGDAKLALAIGLLLGFSSGLSALVLAFWIGTVVTLSIMILSHLHSALFRKGKSLTMKSEIPFAPFLIIGAWISLIYHLDLFHVLTLIK